MDIRDFLLARINEDELDAVLASRRPEARRGERWTYHRGRIVDPFGDEVRDSVQAVAKVLRGARHIARHDPARILAECAAKRAIVEVHQSYFTKNSVCMTCREIFNDDSEDYPCQTIRTLAAVYSDHPDYQPEWSA